MPKLKMPKLKVAKIESCQNWKFPILKVSKVENKLLSCQVAKLSSCQVAKLPNYQVAKLWACDHGAKSLSFLFYLNCHSSSSIIILTPQPKLMLLSICQRICRPPCRSSSDVVGIGTRWFLFEVDVDEMSGVWCWTTVKA